MHEEAAAKIGVAVFQGPPLPSSDGDVPPSALFSVAGNRGLQETTRARLSLRSSEVAGEVADAAVGNMSELFGRRGRPGVQMATRAMRLAMPAERVEVLILSYAQELLAAAGSV